ncbi:MAG: class I SAM-dependent methyltransferase [Ruminiclostridium sp.]|nr:class I SAM-dependent methyltransferase [Ruminiclostridium sp.]
MQKDIEEKAKELMHLSGFTGDVTRTRLEHRLRLVDFWKIYYGSRILEIGCGQGETTACLAYAAGENGFVYAVDLANENYGSPEDLGTARERLMYSHIGDRINIDLGVNILSPSFDFEPNSFGYVVLSHCLWYLSSQEELRDILFKVRNWAPRICLAEWDPRVTSFGQYRHFMAANIQAICEAYHISDHFNIKTMFYPSEIENALASCGWDVTSTALIDAYDVQDALWEIDIVKDMFPRKISEQKDMPPKLKRLLLSQIHALGDAEAAEPLPVFAVTAERIGEIFA